MATSQRLACGARVLVALVFGCNSSESVPPPSLTVETFFAGIDTLPDSYAGDRLAALAPELASTAVDVLCLQGMWQAEDRANLKTSLEEIYPFSVDLPASETTPADDPPGTEPNTPPCASPWELDELERQLVCLASQCSDASSPESGPDAHVRSVACVAHHCGLSDDADRGRCHQCLHAEWRSGASFREMSERCTSVVSPLAYRGEHGLLLLSHLPLGSPSLHVLPSKWMRRAVVGASIDVPAGGGAVDVYCTALGPTEEGGLPGDPFVHDPYPGEMTPGTGWAIEQAEQIDRLISHVRARSAGRRAVILGTFNAGPGHVKESGVVLVERGREGFERLMDAFADGAAPDHDPVCTICPDNPLRNEEHWQERGAEANESIPLLDGTWTNRVYLHELDTAFVTASLRTHVGDIVTVAPDAVLAWPEWRTGGSAPLASFPLSVQYGFRSRIELGR